MTFRKEDLLLSSGEAVERNPFSCVRYAGYYLMGKMLIK
jgi:hypothetical protein